jgi:hypothetical protein
MTEVSPDVAKPKAGFGTEFLWFYILKIRIDTPRQSFVPFCWISLVRCRLQLLRKFFTISHDRKDRMPALRRKPPAFHLFDKFPDRWLP